MLHNLKPYPAYKDSCVPWLGEVPEHWKLQSLGSLTTARSQRNRPDLPLLSVVREKGVIPRSSMRDDENHNFIPDDLSNYKVANEGDLVINKMKAWQGSLGISPQDGIVSPAYYVFEFQISNRKFGHILLRSKPYVAFFGQVSDGVRVGQWDLSINGMKRIPIVIPSLAEQSAIVRYLDYIDRRIRRYIRAKKKLIKLLEEQKQAIIHQAVTRGLDPNVRFKPSGVEWLEEIPEHWEEAKLKFLSRKITDGEHISPPIVDEGIPLLSAKDVRDWKISYVVDKFVLPELAKQFWQRCCPLKGDLLVVSRGATIGRVAVVEDEKPFCLMGSVILCQCRDEYSNEFLYYALNAKHAQTSLWFASASSAQPAIYIEDVAELRLPIPPIHERKLIVESLKNSISQIHNVVEKTQEEISFLREYRTRLIADVVTGKLDVREAAADLPEETDETETFDDSLSEDDELENNEIENEQAGELEEEVLA